MAELSRKGREYMHWPITNAPDNVTVWEALIEGSWHPMTRDGDALTLLVQGPDVETPDGTALTLTGTATGILIRATDTPEQPVRDGGTIRLVN